MMTFEPNRRCVCRGALSSVLLSAIPTISMAQNNSDDIIACGELHPTPDEIEEVLVSIEEENEDDTRLGGQEAAALRVHPKWGRWNPKRISQNRPLRVAFMQHDHPMNAFVVQAANEWQKHMRLKFEFVGTFRDKENPGNLDILVTQDQTGNSSYLGVTSRRYARKGFPTLKLQKFTNGHSNAQKLGVALHELGHALGLIHEHQSPGAKLNFDKAQVEKYYDEKYGWDADTVETNILSQYRLGGAHKVDIRTEFDQESIMMYALPGSLFANGGSGFTENHVLSEDDKRLIQLIY